MIFILKIIIELNIEYSNMKQRIRLTESDLHRIVKESVKRILRENNTDLDKLKDYLYVWAYGKDVDEVGRFLEKKGAKLNDERVDDGGDNEGEYVMRRLYSLGNYDITLYYSNLDYIVSYISFRKY